MDKKGTVEIRIEGRKGGLGLAPESYDITEIRSVLDSAERMLFPGDRRNRPLISYEIREGSVRHLFKTSLQAVIGFNAVLGGIETAASIDFLEHPTARALSQLQNAARRYDYRFDISTSVEPTNHLVIDSSTRFDLPEGEWIDAEFYFYGEITDMGGKGQPNVHVSMPGVGTFTIDTPREVLASYEKNPLYKPMGVRATGRQRLLTGEIDRSSLKFKEFVDYQRDYDEEYLNELIDRARDTWNDVDDPDSWIRELRGADY